MSTPQVQYKSEKSKVKSVYYAGSSTIKDGYLFCHNQDLVTGGSGDTAWTVEKPATANLNYFAGVVAEGDCGAAGRAGPGWYHIAEPDSAGREVKVRPNVALTANTTVVAVSNAVWYGVAVAAGKHAIGIAKQTGGTTTGAALVKVRIGNAKQYLTATATGCTAPAGGVGATATKTFATAIIADILAIKTAK